MKPEKKKISVAKNTAATLAMALGVFAQARSAQSEAPAAPTALTASSHTQQHNVIFKFRPTSGYEERHDPIEGLLRQHKGFDFAAPVGTPVTVPLGDGVVAETGWKFGYGKYVDVSYGRDNEGNYISLRFAHLSRIEVSEGQHVTQTQLIGKVGMTGHTEGPNVHVELRVNDVPANLVRYDPKALPAWVVQPSAQMMDVEMVRDGHKVSYRPLPGDRTSIVAALDPASQEAIRLVRSFENDSDGKPVYIENDDGKGVTYGGLNAEATGIPVEKLRKFKEDDFKRVYETLYLASGARRIATELKKPYFDYWVHGGPTMAEAIYAKAHRDAFQFIKAGSEYYNKMLVKHPGYMVNRNGWNARQLALADASGITRSLDALELIKRVPADKTLLASNTKLSHKKKSQQDSKPIMVAEAETPAPKVFAELGHPKPQTPLSNGLSVSPSTPLPVLALKDASLPTATALAKNAGGGGKSYTPTANQTVWEAAAAAMAAIMFAVGLRQRKLTVVKNKSSAARNAEPVRVSTLAERRAEFLPPLFAVKAAPGAVASKPEVVPPVLTKVVGKKPVAPVVGVAKAAVTDITARASKIARIEPPVTAPAKPIAPPKAAPTSNLKVERSIVREAATSAAGRATIIMTAASKDLQATQSLRGKVSTTASGAIQVQYNDGLDRNDPFKDGSRVVTEKDRTTLYNAHPSDDRVLEATLLRVAKEYKGNFNIKVKGANEVEQQRMAVRIKRISRELGLADRVNLVTADGSGAWIMHARSDEPRRDIQAMPGRTTVEATRQAPQVA